MAMPPVTVAVPMTVAVPVTGISMSHVSAPEPAHLAPAVASATPMASAASMVSTATEAAHAAPAVASGVASTATPMASIRQSARGSRASGESSSHHDDHYLT
jgi:hypothetical protein